MTERKSLTNDLNGDIITSAMKSNETTFVYFIVAPDVGCVKIGRSVNLLKRLRALQTFSPVRLYLHAFTKVQSDKAAKRLEKKLHRDFCSHLVHGEWFNFDITMQKYIRDTVGFFEGCSPDILSLCPELFLKIELVDNKDQNS